MQKLFTLSTLFLISLSAFAQHGISRFEQFGSKKDSVVHASKTVNKIVDGDATFYADTSKWGTWNGWALSSYTDTLTPDFTNQFSSITGGGINGSNAYLVAYSSPSIKLSKQQEITGMFITNTTYADSVIVNGNGFTKKFGGSTGDDPDYFMVRAYGLNNGTVVDSSDFYLADYTPKANAGDYSLEEWKWWDLSVLGSIDSLSFKFFSTDVGQFGINTPTYFCIDNFNGVAPSKSIEKLGFESFNVGGAGFLNGSDLSGGFLSSNVFLSNNYNPTFSSWSGFSISDHTDTTTTGFGNQYSSFAGEGANGSQIYAVGNTYGNAVLELPYKDGGNALQGVMISNATYAALSMRNGDNLAKKFGGTSGDDQDWLKLEIIGYGKHNNPTDTVEFYLADYRFTDNSQDYIVKDWTWVDLSSIKNAVRLEFELSSSDVGQYGMNTPAYFCIDNFQMGDPISTLPARSEALSIYPNPVQDVLNIQSLDERSTLTIASLNGQVVYHGAAKSSVDVSNLNAGTYLVQVVSDKRVTSTRFIKL